MTSLAQASGILFTAAIKAAFLLALALLAEPILRRCSAATRYMARTLLLSAVIVLPVLGTVLPDWQLRVLPSNAPEQAHPAAIASSAEPGPAPEYAPTTAPAPGAHQASARPARSPRMAAVKPQPSVSTSVPDAVSPQAGATHVRSTPPFRVNWPAALGLAWLCGVLAIASRWLMSIVQLRKVLRQAVPLVDKQWQSDLQRARRVLGIRRPVRFLVSRETDVPFASGWLHPAVILPAEYADWAAFRRISVLVHELAHIKRADIVTHALAQLARAIYWFNPLVWIIIRAMRNERERACDDYVLANGAAPSDYAHELLDIVSGTRESLFAAALGMARKSQLEGRVLALLDPKTRRGPVSLKIAVGSTAVMLALAAPLAALRPIQDSPRTPQPAQAPAVAPQPGTPASAPAPAIVPLPTSGGEAAPEADGAPAAAPPIPAATPRPDAPAPAHAAVPASGLPAPEASSPTPSPAMPAPPAAPAAPSAPAAPAPFQIAVPGCAADKNGSHSFTINDDGNRKSWKATWSGDNCSVDLRAEGEIVFNADVTEIQSISQGGYFEVNVREGDKLRQVRVTPSASGLQYVYKLNGQQQPLEGDAKTWFSGILLGVERSTGFSAKTRVPALLQRGGPDAVLNEINNLNGDYVRSIYFRILLEQPNLPAPLVQRIIRQAAAQINSDYALAQVLMTVAGKYDLADEASRTEFLNATSKLKSDYEHSRVLIEILKRPNLSHANVAFALNSASSLKSDYEKSRVLQALIELKAFDQADLPVYLKTVAGIQSDYEKSRDLLAPLQKYQLDAAGVAQVLNAAAQMGSDYEKSRLLITLAGKGKLTEAQMGAYMKVIQSIHSDYERSRTLLALMQNNQLSEASTSSALEALAGMGSDYEKSRALVALTSAGFTDAQLNSYVKVLDSIKSDYSRSQSIAALLQRSKLGDAQLARVLDSVGRMSGDYEKGRTLQSIAAKYPLHGNLREAYIRTAESIQSETERNRALAAVARTASM